MYVVSFIDDGKLIQVSTPSATVAATLQGYLLHQQCRVFKQNKLVHDIKQEALIVECQRRYGKAFIAQKVRSVLGATH